MIPKEFVTEVYRRMSKLNAQEYYKSELLSVDDYLGKNMLLLNHQSINYRDRLPRNLDAAILDIGCGEGHFTASCLKWGYRNLFAMDYSSGHIEQLKKWGVKDFYQVTTDIPTTLSKKKNLFDVIHAAHLIEHIPKHDLLENVDSMFYALKPGGKIIFESPNMFSPAAMGSLFCTLGHEYGFTEHNLTSLFNICGFCDISVHPVRVSNDRLRSRLGNTLRFISVLSRRVTNRLYGWRGAITSASILIEGIKPEVDPLPERLKLQALSKKT